MLLTTHSALLPWLFIGVRLFMGYKGSSKRRQSVFGDTAFWTPATIPNVVVKNSDTLSINARKYVTVLRHYLVSHLTAFVIAHPRLANITS